MGSFPPVHRRKEPPSGNEDKSVLRLQKPQRFRKNLLILQSDAPELFEKADQILVFFPPWIAPPVPRVGKTEKPRFIPLLDRWDPRQHILEQHRKL